MEGMMDAVEEIKLLKNTVKAQAKMIMGYRLGILPEWVFTVLDKAKDQYGEDLTKIK